MFIKREGKDDCLISGYVVGDQKTKEYNDQEFIEFGISMGKDEKGENLPIVNIAVWHRTIPTISKGDRVFACGRLKQAKKDDKTYYSLDADFCIKEIRGDTKAQDHQPELEPIDDDSLPF